MAATDVARSRLPAEVAVHRGGARGVGEFRCSGCGYGIVSRAVLPVCPMCQGSSWEESPWRPFTRRDQ